MPSTVAKVSFDDLHLLTLRDLLRLNAQMREELGRRGISRTASSVEGELGEYLANLVYGGELAPPNTATYDLVDRQGRFLQVKARALPSGKQRIFQFSSSDFDIAICLRFARESGELEWAREIPREELLRHSSARADGLRVRTSIASRIGRDVTAKFRSVYEDRDTSRG
ncbi:DUF6998 domain-containing protein [Brevibacterium aurantiacum]|uniref:DUF6998 domain-containing protein n=1 Tax=Brevibacterium aurantiacum TaxID=273384 RepID=UPI00384AF00C